MAKCECLAAKIDPEIDCEEVCAEVEEVMTTEKSEDSVYACKEECMAFGGEESCCYEYCKEGREWGDCLIDELDRDLLRMAKELGVIEQ